MSRSMVAGLECSLGCPEKGEVVLTRLSKCLAQLWFIPGSVYSDHNEALSPIACSPKMKYQKQGWCSAGTAPCGHLRGNDGGMAMEQCLRPRHMYL